MGIAFPQCLWGIPEMTAVPATIVGMLQYKRPSTDEKSQSHPSERERPYYFKYRLAEN